MRPHSASREWQKAKGSRPTADNHRHHAVQQPAKAHRLLHIRIESDENPGNCDQCRTDSERTRLPGQCQMPISHRAAKITSQKYHFSFLFASAVQVHRICSRNGVFREFFFGSIRIS